MYDRVYEEVVLVDQDSVSEPEPCFTICGVSSREICDCVCPIFSKRVAQTHEAADMQYWMVVCQFLHVALLIACPILTIVESGGCAWF